MMLIWTYFVKWLIPIIVFILSFLLLNLVSTRPTSDPKDICMNCPDVTRRCIKSHLCHVVSLSTCTGNVFTYVYIIVLHVLSIFSMDMYVCYV